jgi:hypothetical protein
MKLSLRKLSLPSAAVLLSVMFAATLVKAARVMLYENDFEAPKMALTPDPSFQLMATGNFDVNVLYGGQGGPGHSKTVYGNGTFGQRQTVETLAIHSTFVKSSPHHPYVDPDGIAGNYAIGMLATYDSGGGDDRAWLDFNAPADLQFFTVELDISAIEPSSGTGPNENTAAAMDLILSDISGPNPRVISTQRVDGKLAPNPYTFNWAHGITNFNKGSATSLRITFDAISPSYMCFDNLKIYADVVAATPAPTLSPTPSPTLSPTPSPTPVSAGQPLTGTGNGDPHFKTWNGLKYEVSLRLSSLFVAFPGVSLLFPHCIPHILYI